MSLQREILSPVTTNLDDEPKHLYVSMDIYPVRKSRDFVSSFAYAGTSNSDAEYGQPSIFPIDLGKPPKSGKQYSLTASNSITFPKQNGETAAVVQKVAEGVEIPLDVTAYTSVNVVPYKIAHGFIITKEMIEDSLIPIQQDQLVRSALRFANKIDRDKN